MKPGPKPKPAHEYTQQQNYEFCRLLEKYQGAIHHTIRKFPYVNHEFDHDDYYQEAVIQAWTNFHKYTPQEGSDFGSWLMAVTERAVKQCRRNYFERHFRIRLVEDTTPFEGDMDTDYSEEHIESLKRAISDLPDHYKNDIQMYLDNTNLRGASVDAGHAPAYFSGRVSAIVKIIRDRKDRYFEGMIVDYTSLHKNNGSNGRTNERAHQSRPIDQFDTDGNLIHRWPSGAEACRNGYNKMMLHYALKEGKPYRGFTWKHSSERLVKDDSITQTDIQMLKEVYRA